MIEDWMDLENLDPDTFTFGIVMFGDRIIHPAPASHTLETIEDLRPERNLIVKINAEFDPSTGKIHWELSTLDPSTWQAPGWEGFLPPNTDQPQGEGSVSYSIALRDGRTSGTVVGVNQRSSIVFDTNAAIETADWQNTLDGELPASSMESRNNPTSTTFQVSWSGSDAVSGIRDFSVYVAEDSGSYEPWLVRTSLAQADFTGVSRKTYRFFSIARDQAGNVEADPVKADLTVTVVIPGDLDGSGVVDCADYAIVKASLNKRTGQTGFDSRADINLDGIVNIRDLSFVSRLLPAGTKCP